MKVEYRGSFEERLEWSSNRSVFRIAKRVESVVVLGTGGGGW